MTIDDFVNIADEELRYGDYRYIAVVNRSSSRFRDLLPLLAKNEKLCEVFVLKSDVSVGDVFTTEYNEFIVVIEVRECIDRRITHFIGAIRSAVIQRDNEVIR